jgi:hypothetical protein
MGLLLLLTLLDIGDLTGKDLIAAVKMFLFFLRPGSGRLF